MILSYLLLVQAAVWPAIPAQSVSNWYKLPAPTLATSAKIAGKAATLEVILFPSAATTIRIGPATLRFDSGRMTLNSGRYLMKSNSIGAGAPLDLVITRNKADVRILANGRLFNALNIKDATIPVTISGEGNQLVAMANYPRILTSAEIQKNGIAGAALANSLPESATMVLKIKILATTEAPDPNRIKPYRNALIAQEYTVQIIVAGHTKALKQGAKVRVFRYGVFDGKRTGVDNLQAPPVVVTVELMSANPARSHEYQIDDLDSDMLAKYYVEVAKPKK